MNPRTILIELIFFATPFIIFGVYRLMVRDAEEHGRKSWPISVLFMAGFVFAMVGWFGLVMTQDRSENKCYEKAQVVDGKLVPGRTYACDKDLEGIGTPASSDPGGDEDSDPQ